MFNKCKSFIFNIKKFYLKKLFFFINFRKQYDEILISESMIKEEPLPPAENVFKIAVKLFKIFSFDKDEKRLELYTRYVNLHQHLITFHLNY